MSDSMSGIENVTWSPAAAGKTFTHAIDRSSRVRALADQLAEARERAEHYRLLAEQATETLKAVTAVRKKT